MACRVLVDNLGMLRGDKVSEGDHLSGRPGAVAIRSVKIVLSYELSSPSLEPDPSLSQGVA